MEGRKNSKSLKIQCREREGKPQGTWERLWCEVEFHRPPPSPGNFPEMQSQALPETWMRRVEMRPGDCSNQLPTPRDLTHGLFQSQGCEHPECLILKTEKAPGFPTMVIQAQIDPGIELLCMLNTRQANMSVWSELLSTIPSPSLP